MDTRYVHLVAAKHVLRYLKGIIEYGIKYTMYKRIKLHDYVDSDWEGSAMNRKSNL